jgi:hypothetical protein
MCDIFVHKASNEAYTIIQTNNNPGVLGEELCVLWLLLWLADVEGQNTF